ncbi:hypothetical protein B484DRAFT_423651 [Ochromonadaceae sp. CCMP2298]|nr:hypothetical protein B484DRAFT_423651 [Ochromonadaceae sp. CCMP2298]
MTTEYGRTLSPAGAPHGSVRATRLSLNQEDILEDDVGLLTPLRKQMENSLSVSGPLDISLKDKLLFIERLLIPSFDPDNELDTSKKRKEWMGHEANNTEWGTSISAELIKIYGTVKSLEKAETLFEKAERLLEKAEENERKQAFVIRYGSIPKKIYVRDCYKTLYKCAAQSRIRQQNGYSATLFTGVPGIGKSLFLVYFIYRFLADERFADKKFALEFTRGEYVCFQPSDAHGEFWCSNEDGIRMHSKRFLLLCDISDAVEPVSRAKWTYIFSSPAPARYKEILKNSPCQEYTLPTWSELELMFVSGDTGNWYDDFVLFGGVPRYIFPNRDPHMSPTIDRDPHMLMRKALKEKGGAIAESFFKFGLGMADWLQSYMLVHINPPLSAAGEFDYSGETEYTFASDAIFQWLAKKHSTQMLAGAVGMFNVGAASESYGAVSAGKLFEKSGDSFYLVLLPTGGYLLVVLQITVGKSHPVKVNGLHDILLAYLQDVREHVVSKALVFVLPANGELDREQALHTQKEEQMDSSRVPVAVRDFQQYVYRHTI